MKEQKKSKVTRRDFLGLSALGLANLTILPSWTMADGNRIAPSDRVVTGFIGLGRQAPGDFNSLIRCPGVQVVAGSDVDTIKNRRFHNIVTEWQRRTNQPESCDTYVFYERMLERKDLDAVVIGTPDHWHALNTIHSCQAGKDVYLQKPVAYNISECIATNRAVRYHKRILQVGSQQRSDREFEQAFRVVRSGVLGHITNVHVKVGDFPSPFNLREDPIPSNVNFNKWLGPLNFPAVHFNLEMVPQIGPPYYRETGPWAAWRWYNETGNGFIGDWGAHHYDIAQWALGLDGLTATEYIPSGWNGTQFPTWKYANGLVMEERPFRDDRPDDRGIKFIGSNGWLRVARGFIEASNPNWLDGSLDVGNEDDVAQESPGHFQDWINCVRSRTEPIAPVEAGSSTNILFCNIIMAQELGRPLHWCPVTNRYRNNDPEALAHRLYYYEYRRPYRLPFWWGG